MLADPREDEELLAAVVEGDRSSLQVLYERHAPWILLRLTRRCPDPGIVEDVVQDTFMAVWRRPGGFRGSGAVPAWLWGIAIRRLVDRLRRRGAPVLAMAWTERWSTPGEETFEPSAEEQVLLGIEYGDLAGALNRLSPELRAVLRATALDGLTTREAATLLGIPAGTVKTRLMRARAQLREALT
jgi:RNA polymerase sigma-70 factor, ECF subfamily